MLDAILIFTFSPVQPFIAEARRASDLFVGSRILVELATAAAKVLDKQGKLIYPPQPMGDVPNVLVARLPWRYTEETAKMARVALLQKWGQIAKSAKEAIAAKSPEVDDVWETIWSRQTAADYLWEVYWAAAPDEGNYKDAYEKARRALEATKRTRLFVPAEEASLKDSLSGKREALHTSQMNAKEYWQAVGSTVPAARLRPYGRERLDAIGAIKRFCCLAREGFLSTSSVASADYLEKARPHLRDYRAAVERLLGERRYRVRDDPDWPYDGDLFFRETLEPGRLRDSYGLPQPDPTLLAEARRALAAVYKQVGERPSPYYAIIVLDGDGMGERIGLCRSEEEHRALSRRLSEFAQEVAPLVQEHKGECIYNGGDDVLALTPLSTASRLAQALAERFIVKTRANEKDDKATASAGVAIVHHLYPLDAALNAAREAEKAAKKVPGKAALCVRVLRRSGEATEMRSKWADMTDNLMDDLIDHFRKDALSSRFAYDVLNEARVVTALEDQEARRAVLRRLVKRHKTDALAKDAAEALVERLHRWAQALDQVAPPKDDQGFPQGLLELGHWLVFARFVAQGGSE